MYPVASNLGVYKKNIITVVIMLSCRSVGLHSKRNSIQNNSIQNNSIQFGTVISIRNNAISRDNNNHVTIDQPTNKRIPVQTCMRRGMNINLGTEAVGT